MVCDFLGYFENHYFIRKKLLGLLFCKPLVNFGLPFIHTSGHAAKWDAFIKQFGASQDA